MAETSHAPDQITSVPPGAAPLRIAFVLDRFPSLHQTFVLAEMRALERLGHELTVFSMSRPVTAVPAAALLRARVVYAPPRGGVGSYVRAKVAALHHPAAYLATAAMIPGDRLRPAASSWLRGLAFAHAAGSLELDHVHAHFATGANVAAVTMARLLDVPVSFTTHAVDLYARPVRLCRTLEASKLHVTVSEYNRAFLSQHCPHAPHIEVIFDAISPEDFVPRHSDETKESAGSFRVVSVGRLVPKKGHEVLVEAAAMLRDRGQPIELTIVGDGPGRDTLEAAVRRFQLGDHVRVAGALHADQVRDLLRSADAFALACTIGPDGDRDGIPVAIMEAMATALPVVSTTVSGIAELVTPETGILVPPDQPAAIADALAVLIADPPRRATLGAAAREQVLRLCNVHTNAARLAELMRAP